MTSPSAAIDLRRCATIVGRSAAVLSVAVMLAGCIGGPDTTASIPDDYRQRHPIAIQEGDRTVELFVGSKRGGLTPVQRAEVLGFAQAWKREATGGILIDLPSGTANEQAAREALHEIKSILAAAEVPARAIADRPYQPPDLRQSGPVRLNYPRVTATAGPCGLWPHDLGPSNDPVHIQNKEYWNLGCATQRNMASMVAEPADLVQPRVSTPAYTARRTAGMDKYRQGQSPSTVYTDSAQGRISDLGQ